MAEENPFIGAGQAHRHRASFSGTILSTVAAMVVGALILAAIGLYSATYEGDAASVERQARSAQHALEIGIDELALQQETVAVWDDAAAYIVPARRDMTWIHDNIGSWLHRIFRHDEAFILDEADRPIYAAVEGESVPIQRYRVLSGDLAGLVNNVRGRGAVDNGLHDRNPGRPLADASSVRTTPRAIHDSHMLLVGGRPAAASAMLIKPSTQGYVQPNGQWPILISVRYLDAGFLAELSAKQLIESPRFSRRADLQPGEHAIALQSEFGDRIGFLVWQPELPGTRILWKLLPLNLLILIALGSVIGLLARRLWKAAGELAAAEGHAAHLAFHDSLTGLPNRALFQERLDRLTSAVQGGGPRFALVLLDVDEFKLTNDMLGHDAGDALLRAFADRLRRACRPTDLVARLGGDEFALLLEEIDGSSAVEAFAGKLQRLLEEPCEHQGKVIECRASVGASLHGGRGAPDDVLKQADLALYSAKTAGRGVFRLYEPGMKATMLARSTMLSVARRALTEDWIRPFYQPKVDLRSGKVVGFEALLRCCPPDAEPHGPDKLAAAFDDSALARQLSDRMIDRVIADVVTWRAGSLPFGHVAVNAAAAELRRGDFADRFLRRLTAAGIPADCMQIEVTESVLLGRNVDHVERSLRTLAEAGMKLALDDFGTGFASLSHLKQYPVDIIKIDRTFVRDLQVNPGDGAIVNALVGLARALDIQVVAEGIETQIQRDFLAALGCAQGQGFLFGRAVSADEATASLRGVRRRDRAAA